MALSNNKNLDDNKQKIINLFLNNVKGKKPDISSYNKKHSGKEGHWLETQMGILHNASNTPDIFGFEMKNETNSKTTFGDWSANYYIFQDPKFGINRDDFLKIFGMANSKKDGRYSWSGKPCPKIIDIFNKFGQTIKIDHNNNIMAVYNYKMDSRANKKIIIPNSVQLGDIVLARWNAKDLKLRVERKFNNNGWFKCIKNNDDVYINIVFGKPVNFRRWITGVKAGLIFFDSGMYQGNSRNYSQWRANNKYWDSLIID